LRLKPNIKEATKMKIETAVVHGGQKPDPTTGAIIPNITTSVSGAFRGLDEPSLIEYGREQNPTRSILEKLVGELEGGKYCFAFSSGLSAIHGVLSTLDQGDHIILGKNLYGGTIRLANTVLSKFLKIDYVDLNNLGCLSSAIKPNTKYILVESPANPLLDIVDLELLGSISSSAGVPYILDNTFATPVLQRGFDLGAEVIVHSITKYLSGHNNVVGGLVVTNNSLLAEKLVRYQKTLGAILSPFDCYSTILGIKTLALRMERHCENAQKVAEFLESQENISRVYYPGLKSHPAHEIASKQMSAYGGMVSFEVKGDYKKFARAVTSQDPPIVYLAKSLGATESLLSHPATMSHKDLGAKAREDIGIKDNLFRLSVGIEHVDDIIYSLKTALEAAK
jgi:cysteine-S-conjugate beta-lyase